MSKPVATAIVHAPGLVDLNPGAGLADLPVGTYELAQTAAQVAASNPAEAELAQIYDLFGIGSEARSIQTLMVSLRNVLHFTDLLHAVEREFFMVPGEVDDEFPDDEPADECLVNCWGSTAEEYIEQFRAAITTMASKPAAASGEADAMRFALHNIANYRTDVDSNIAARSMRFYAEQALATPPAQAPALPATTEVAASIAPVAKSDLRAWLSGLEDVAHQNTGAQLFTKVRTYLQVEGYLAAPVVAVPEGWKLVPLDPATALNMGWAYLDAARECDPRRDWAFSHAGYAAMLAAAPSPAMRNASEGGERG